MICNTCNLSKNIDEMVDYPGKKEGKHYIGKKCKKCVIAAIVSNTSRRRKIVGSKDWLSKRLYALEHNAKRRGYAYELSIDETIAIYLTEICYYCGEATDRRSVDRIDNTKGYTADNCVMACIKCNKLKGQLVKSDIQRMLLILNKI